MPLGNALQGRNQKVESGKPQMGLTVIVGEFESTNQAFKEQDEPQGKKEARGHRCIEVGDRNGSKFDKKHTFAKYGQGDKSAEREAGLRDYMLLATQESVPERKVSSAERRSM
ncbi:hypothetical protein NDU88_003484 [Pleurodeles waltl]|uniref:Uncharacterized protein n=1 Tax=Pleurodeles waltl TaxID=8319 RepID=A0AAV7NPU7_PLEWA|nr:hypothetical protein NDU88_003484 [Pleurodeles waltl]